MEVEVGNTKCNAIIGLRFSVGNWKADVGRWSLDSASWEHIKETTAYTPASFMVQALCSGVCRTGWHQAFASGIVVQSPGVQAELQKRSRETVQDGNYRDYRGYIRVILGLMEKENGSETYLGFKDAMRPGIK